MTTRRWLLILGLALWLVLLILWIARGGTGTDGGWDILSLALLLLPLLLANEIFGIFQRWIRRRREKRDA
ncbi:hypothetical protein [Psychromarinibacter sp. S121]|uniref:hypothetical protein n=1 Tax=Psychromarinibacter sp. S121 TaxID=3415127 RepID=UPI003C7DA6F7